MDFLNHSRWYWFAFAIILASFAALMFKDIGQEPLLDYDEAIYAEVAREAYESGDHLGFTWLGNLGLGRDIHWFEKPPLMIWLIELAYSFGGVNEFTARLPAALFALATISLAGLFASNIFASKVAGLLAMLAHLLAFQFLQYSKILQFDIPVGFFMLLSLYGFLKARQKQNYFLLFWIAIGLGVLTKSIIGLLPFVALGLYTLLSQDWQYLKEKRFWQGLLLAVTMTAPWHIIESIRFGQPFWQQYAFYHLFQRFTTELEQHSGPFSFYWEILQRQRALYVLAIISTVYFALKSFRKKRKELLLFTPLENATDNASGYTNRFLTGFVAVISFFLSFSLSRTKLPAYILVIYPLLAVLIGVMLERLTRTLPGFLRTFGMAGIMLTMIVAGWKHSGEATIMQNQQVAQDNKKIGNYLLTHESSLPVYYRIAAGPSPAIIFYSHRALLSPSSENQQGVTPALLVTEKNLPDAGKLLLTTPTRKLYLTGSP